MLNILKHYNYTLPNFKEGTDYESSKYGSTGINNKMEIKNINNDKYLLTVNNDHWMMYELQNHNQASQLFSHYYIAEGDVVVTGLGLAVRENWLINKPSIKSIKVIERSSELIEYHKNVNPQLLDKVEFINCDAREYKGKCNSLLLDHYEFENIYDIINDVKFICNNIECNNMWFWHLETLIIANLHNVPEHTLCHNFRNNKFVFDTRKLNNVKQTYENIKIFHGLNKLPELDEYELMLFLSMYSNFFTKL